MDSFKSGEGVHQGCILSPCLLNLYAEYIMRNAGLHEAQAGIKTAGRNNNNLRYADDTTLIAETEYKLGICSFVGVCVCVCLHVCMLVRVCDE